MAILNTLIYKDQFIARGKFVTPAEGTTDEVI